MQIASPLHLITTLFRTGLHLTLPEQIVSCH